MPDIDNQPEENPESIANRLISKDFVKREREKAINFLMKYYAIQRYDAAEIVQNAFLELFEGIKSGRRVVIESTLSAYFLGICFNKAKDFLKKRKLLRYDFDLGSFVICDDDIDDISEKDIFDRNRINLLSKNTNSSITEEQRVILHDLVQHLPPPCEDILWYCFRDNLKMAAIADILGYSGADTVRTKKSRCISKLRAEFNRRKEEYYAASSDI